MSLVVAIDGPAGTGKSTVAAKLASRLGWVLLDTGAMYRAVALAALEAGIGAEDEAGVVALASGLRFEQKAETFRLNGRDITFAIRAPEISQEASRVARLGGVRAILVGWQREFAADRSTVTEGRDQGTVVFPDAFCKIYLTASAEARARRRFLELEGRGGRDSLAEVLAEQAERDERDARREHGPLKAAEDALIVDTTSLPADLVVDLMEAWCRAELSPNDRSLGADRDRLFLGVARGRSLDDDRLTLVAGTLEEAQDGARRHGRRVRLAAPGARFD